MHTFNKTKSTHRCKRIPIKKGEPADVLFFCCCCVCTVPGTYDGSMCGQEDGIRRTMYYYGPSAYSGAGFSNFSGHWDYNYTEAKMISAPGT